MYTDFVAQAPAKDRRRVASRTKVQEDSDVEEELEMPPPPLPAVNIAAPTPNQPAGNAPTALAQAAQAAIEQAALQEYQKELADWIIYDLMRSCARSMRALAVYDCRLCLEELEKLPPAQQRSAWTMAMVGKAHYEVGEYSAVSGICCLPVIHAHV